MVLGTELLQTIAKELRQLRARDLARSKSRAEFGDGSEWKRRFVELGLGLAHETLRTEREGRLYVHGNFDL